MQLYKMELYKLIHRKVFFTGLIAVVGIILIYFWFSVLGAELAVVDETTYMGYEAVQVNREITEEFAGIITDEKVELIVEKYGIPSKLVDGIPGWKAFVEMCHFSLMLGSALLVCSISGVFAEEGTTKMLPLLACYCCEQCSDRHCMHCCRILQIQIPKCIINFFLRHSLMPFVSIVLFADIAALDKGNHDHRLSRWFALRL